MKQSTKGLSGVLTIVILLLVWQLVYTTGLVTMTSLPSPLTIGAELVQQVTSGQLFGPLWHTVWVVIVASTVAILLGTLLGAILGLSGLAYRWGMASVDFMRTLPAVALLPVAVMLWGPSTQTELIVTVYAALWVMTVSAAGAFSTVHVRLGEVSRVLRLTKFDGITKVWLPAATSGLLVGARLAVVTASLTAIIAEALVNPHGLGYEIVSSQWSFQPARLWAYAIVAGVFGYLLNVILIAAVRVFSPGGRANSALIGA